MGKKSRVCLLLFNLGFLGGIKISEHAAVLIIKSNELTYIAAILCRLKIFLRWSSEFVFDDSNVETHWKSSPPENFFFAVYTFMIGLYARMCIRRRIYADSWISLTLLTLMHTHAPSVRPCVFPVTWPMTSSISSSSCTHRDGDTDRQRHRVTHIRRLQ